MKVITLKNFDYNKDDYYTRLNERIQYPLSKFLAIYILMFNEFLQIKTDSLINTFDYCIITTLTFLEISIIKNYSKKLIHFIIKLLNLYVKILATKKTINYEDVNNNLNQNLRLIVNETIIQNINYEILTQKLKFNTFYIKLIYSVILIILIEINKRNSTLPDLISKHNKIVLTINKYNNSLSSYCFPNIDNLSNYNIKNLLNQLNNDPIYNINENIFQEIIHIIQKILFNDGDDMYSEFSFNHFRARTLYQKDKENEIKINIDTTKNTFNKTPIVIDDFLLNDSFSHYTTKSLPYYISYSNTQYSRNAKNIDLTSEKINLPYNDNISNNNNYITQNKTLDILSDKSSFNLNLKV